MRKENIHTIDNIPVMCYIVPRSSHVVLTKSQEPQKSKGFRLMLLGYFCAFWGKPSPLTTPTPLLLLIYIREEEEGERGGLRGEKGGRLMAKGFRDCPYCQYVGASDAQLQHHLGKFHEALLAQEGEKARAREKEKPSAGFDPRLHNIVQGYLHGEDKGKVYETEVDTDEGITFRLRCLECNKVLKEWFEKWTPESKERFLKIKEGAFATLSSSPLLQRAGATIGSRL